jgi:hypothetical protein
MEDYVAFTRNERGSAAANVRSDIRIAVAALRNLPRNLYSGPPVLRTDAPWGFHTEDLAEFRDILR